MLRIITDDLGLHKSINEGTPSLLNENKINGALLMANGEAFNDAVSQCLEARSLNIGAHLVLVEEESLSGIQLPGNHKVFFVKYIFSWIKLADIEKESKAQLGKIINAGIKPSFINAHQHLHLLPGIMNIVIKLAKENNIQYIRVVSEPISLGRGKFFRQAQLLFLNFLSELAKNKIKKAGLRRNAYFIGFVNAGDLNRVDFERVRKLVRKYPDKIIELGCHPGHESEELKIKYSHWGNYNWEKELHLFKND